MLPDKTYLRASNMLFNVTGYRHPTDAVYASLKYVADEKWTSGYEAAKSWLRQEHPRFVDEFIQVPLNCIQTVFDPKVRWQTLLAQTTDELLPLHREALQLGGALSDKLAIPIECFGITDSLLWGSGHDASDIDLVVYGTGFCDCIVNGAQGLYGQESFERPDPCVMTAPYASQVADWPSILDRKLHMGSYRDRLFSLRVVMDDQDMRFFQKKDARILETSLHDECTLVDFEVSDARHSLCFPAVYRDAGGNELIDYSVVYEGVYRVGDVVRAECALECVTQKDGSTFDRYVIEGSCWLVR